MKWQFNDGGRVDAGYQGNAGDCVVRAIAIACEIPYQLAYQSMASINHNTRRKIGIAGKKSARNGVDTKHVGFKKYMQSIGWRWTPTMGIGTGCTTHLRDGELPDGRLIVAVSRHYVAVINGVINDTFDPSRNGNRCVYGYWSK